MNILHEITDVIGKMKHFDDSKNALHTLYVNFPAYKRLLEHLKEHACTCFIREDYIQWDADTKIRMTNSFNNNYGYNKPYEE